MKTKAEDKIKQFSILFVDDDNDIKESMAAPLRRRVRKLYTASNGAEGYQLFLEQGPDIIITDLRMPVMDGLEMAARIRSSNPDIPIIVLTAHNDESYFLKAIEIGIVRFVIKPVVIAKVFEVLGDIASSLWQKREVDSFNEFTRFILDEHPSFIAVRTQNEPDYINRSFLSWLGFNSISDFRSNCRGIEECIETIDGITCTPEMRMEWMQNLVCNPAAGRIVSLKQMNADNKTGPGNFLVRERHFPELGRYILTFVNIEYLEEERKRLRQEANIDPLTGINNRGYMLRSLEAEIKKALRYNYPLSLIFFDIDRFKRINDTHGHQSGDDVLQKVAESVSSSIRSVDIFSRWGGEEFMIMLPHTTVDDASGIAEKLRRELEILPHCIPETVTCSFGVTCLHAGDTAESFVERADGAMYDAKHAGRNRACIRIEQVS